MAKFLVIMFYLLAFLIGLFTMFGSIAGWQNYGKLPIHILIGTFVPLPTIGFLFIVMGIIRKWSYIYIIAFIWNLITAVILSVYTPNINKIGTDEWYAVVVVFPILVTLWITSFLLLILYAKEKNFSPRFWVPYLIVPIVGGFFLELFFRASGFLLVYPLMAAVSVFIGFSWETTSHRVKIQT